MKALKDEIRAHIVALIKLEVVGFRLNIQTNDAEVCVKNGGEAVVEFHIENIKGGE